MKFVWILYSKIIKSSLSNCVINLILHAFNEFFNTNSEFQLKLFNSTKLKFEVTGKVVVI